MLDYTNSAPVVLTRGEEAKEMASIITQKLLRGESVRIEAYGRHIKTFTPEDLKPKLRLEFTD